MVVANVWYIMLQSMFLVDDSYHQEVFRKKQIAAGGPYDLVGILLFLYYKYTPRLYPKFMGILGIDLSEKSIKFFLGIMCLFYTNQNQIINDEDSTQRQTTSGLWFSFVPGICGMIASLLCSSSALLPPISRLELPDPFYLLCSRILGPVFIEERPVQRVVRRQRQQPTQGAGARLAPATPVAQPQFQRPPTPPPPSEEAISNLTAMGFDREDVIRALRQSDNNTEIAANRLLGAM